MPSASQRNTCRGGVNTVEVPAPPPAADAFSFVSTRFACGAVSAAASARPVTAAAPHRVPKSSSRALHEVFCHRAPGAKLAAGALTVGCWVLFPAPPAARRELRQVLARTSLIHLPSFPSQQRSTCSVPGSQEPEFSLQDANEYRRPDHTAKEQRRAPVYHAFQHSAQQQPHQQLHTCYIRRGPHEFHCQLQHQRHAEKWRQQSPLTKNWVPRQDASRMLCLAQISLQTLCSVEQHWRQGECAQQIRRRHPSVELHERTDHFSHREEEQQPAWDGRGVAQLWTTSSASRVPARRTSPPACPDCEVAPGSRPDLLRENRDTFLRRGGLLPLHGHSCADNVLPSARVCSFSTSSDRVISVLERRLLQDEKTSKGGGAVYDRQRQGVVLAVADDVLLVRGLSAAPVGTLVTFTDAGALQASAETAAAKGEQEGLAAMSVEAAPAGGKPPAARGSGALPAGEESVRMTAGEEEQTPVLGVVLQLLHQDLNIVGLLGGSSSFSVSTGEFLPYRAPCVGDVCAAVSAFEQESPHLQQDTPAQGDRSQRGAPAQRKNKQQALPSQHEEPQRQPYRLIDAFWSACGSGSVVSPAALLQRVRPAPATGHETGGSELFFNVLDLSLPVVEAAVSRIDITLPWGLPTGSVAVDALAPLQLGETSAFVGPPGTGKTQALGPPVALHAAAAAAAAAVKAAPPADRPLLPPSTGVAQPLVRQSKTAHQPQQKLSVVFLSCGSSFSALHRWLEAVSREAALWSAALSAAFTAAEDTGDAEGLPAAAQSWVGDEETTCASTKQSAQNTGTASGAPASRATQAATPVQNSYISSIGVLHVPAPGAATAGGKDLCGLRAHPTSTLVYLAPLLALRLALEVQAAAAASGTPCPVMLVIDGLAVHPSAVEQLKTNIQKLLSSPSAAIHLPAIPLPAGTRSLNNKSCTNTLSPDGASASSTAPTATTALPFSASSLYGLLSSRASKAAGARGPLSVLLVLDTPTDPALLTARDLQRSATSAVQQRRIEETLAQAIRRKDSVGEVLSQKMAAEVQEALLSAAQRTVLFARGTQQERQHQSAAHAAHQGVQREQQQHRQQPTKAERRAGCTKNLLLEPMYPMIDMDSLVAASTATLSADGCTALSQSCFSRKDTSVEAVEGPSTEALRDTLKALCRRQLCAEKQMLRTMRSGNGEHRKADAPEVTEIGLTVSTRTGFLRFEPPALLAAAAAAFAWQQRTLRSEKERQQLMQQFRLFVDVWEEEDADSLSISSAVCLARPGGRIFSPSEQFILLRAAATLFFTPSGAPATGAERNRRAAGRFSATSVSPWAGAAPPHCRYDKFVSFAQICAFQEDVLRVFRTSEPQLWDAVERHLRRVGDWPLELRSNTLDTTGVPATKRGVPTWNLREGGKNAETTHLQAAADEEEEVELMAQRVMRLLNEVDTALLSMRGDFEITAPSFRED